MNNSFHSLESTLKSFQSEACWNLLATRCSWTYAVTLLPDQHALKMPQDWDTGNCRISWFRSEKTERAWILAGSVLEGHSMLQDFSCCRPAQPSRFCLLKDFRGSSITPELAMFFGILIPRAPQPQPQKLSCRVPVFLKI